MKKFRLFSLLSVLLVVLLMLPIQNVYAFSSSISISDPGQLPEGTSSSVTFTITGSSAFNVQGTVSVSGGGLFTGLSSPGANGASFGTADMSGYTSYSGTISFNVVSADPVVISVSGVVSSIEELVKENYSGSRTISVYSKAQQEADAEAQRKAQEEAARKAAEEEAARRAAEESQREATRAEAESRSREEASIAEEQRKIAESKAIEESKRNASIAESVSAEESSRQESLSIQESEEEESRSIAESEEEESRSIAEESESIEKSISESESIENLTRAFEVGDDYFVPWQYKTDSGRFLFAVDDTNIEAPEGYEKTDLIVNKQYIWAAQSEKTAARTYLVYGTYDEGIEPAFYYFDLDTGRLFPYDNLNSRTDNRPARIETEESTTAEETVPEKTDEFPLDRAILFAVSGAVIGAALFGLLLLLLKIGRNRNTAEPRIFADGPEDPLIPSAGDIDDLEELPLQKEDVSDPDETMKILFGQEAEENQFVDENAEDEIELAIVEEDSVAKTIEEPDPSTIEDESELAVVEEESELPVEEAEAAVKLPKPEDEISLTETPEAAASETIESVPEPEPAAAEPAEEVSPETPAADASSDAIPVIPAVPVETVSDFDKQPDVPKEPPIPDEDLIIPETEEEVPSSETLSSEPAAVGEPILEDDDVEIISEDEVELDSVFDRKS